MSAPDHPVSNDLSPERIRADAASLADTAQTDLSHLGEEVKEQAAALGEEARSQLADATEKAKGLAGDQKALLAEQLGGVSGALQKVAGELESSGDAGGRYVRMIADGADKLTATVRDNDVDKIIGIAQDFGRKQPVAFMGAAALLGFVASRFVMASASRKPDAGSASQSGSTYASNTSSAGYTEGGRNGGY